MNRRTRIPASFLLLLAAVAAAGCSAAPMALEEAEPAEEYSRLKANAAKLKTSEHKVAMLEAFAPRFEGTRYERKVESMLKREAGSSMRAPAPKKMPASRPRRRAPGLGGGSPEAAVAGRPGVPTLPLLAAPGVDPGRADRLVVYNGSVHLVVRDVAHALAGVHAIASRFGGYMQAMDARSITVKVPANRFREAVAEVEALGEVTQKSIKGTDVTEEMRDLRIRLKNAEEVRERLVKLLDKCEKVEDAIKIEKELGRLTEKIEMLKGKIQHMEHSVAYSTLTVHVNSPVPQTKKRVIPIDWVRKLGDGLVRGEVARYTRYSEQKRWIRFDLPEGYIRYSDWPWGAWAMSAEGCYIYIEKRENRKGGGIDFWYKVARRELVEEKAFAVSEEKEPVLGTYADAKMFVATKMLSGKEYGYLLAVVVNRKHVHAFEAWGPLKEFEKDREKLGWAVESLRVKR